MKKVTIARVFCENYKGSKTLEINLSGKDEVSGKNRSGKTTVKDIVFDVLTGKLSDGTTADNVRPVDENGEFINRADVVRGIDIDVDGKKYTISKTTKQKWMKPRGSEVEVFKGNETSYEIDGYPYKAKDFQEWVETNIREIPVITNCISAVPFLNTVKKSTVEARKVLENMSGYTPEVFISEHPEYAEVDDILKGHSAEDAMKKLRKDHTSLKKEIDKKNIEIKYEESREIEDDSEELNKQLEEYKDELESVIEQETAHKDNQSKIDSLKAELRELNERNTRAFNKHFDEYMAQKNDVIDRMTELSTQNSDAISDRDAYKRQLNNAVSVFNNLVQQRNEACQEWKKAKATEFDKTSTVCPYCGRAYESDKIADMKKHFEESKNSHIKELEAKGKVLKRRIDSANKDVAGIREEYDEAVARCEDVGKRYADAKGTYDTYPVFNPAIYEDCVEISKLVGEKEQEIKALTDSANNSALTTKKWNLERNISNTEFELSAIHKLHADKDVAVKRLHDELKAYVLKLAEVERQIDLIKNFSIAKNEALEDAINKHFKHFNFKLFDKTIDGGIIETCQMVVDGVANGAGLNHGDSILSEIDLLNGFQEMNFVNLPIIVDDAESVDPDRIPDLDRQIIVLRRTDGELKVKGI